jgi:outer membrane protein assembly factor BamB/ABC-type phosphate/phosphonate transport system substrate-binding protein
MPKIARRTVLLLLSLATVFVVGCVSLRSGPPAPLRLIVMDPLAAELSCPCVEGHAQRNYTRLTAFLGKQLGRPIDMVFAESLAGGTRKLGAAPALVIGKRATVQFDAASTGTRLRPIAALTGKDGRTDLTGLFVVRSADPAKAIADLKGRSVVFGAVDADEKRVAALDALRSAGLPLPDTIDWRTGCNEAAIAVVEKDADAAVISSYALALLTGCNAIEAGELRVIGRTRPVPFITVFAGPAMPAHDIPRVRAALDAVSSDAALLKVMESRDGFVPLPVPWMDWRGPDRLGLSDAVPGSLPAGVQQVWRTPMTGLGLSGIAATSRRVVVADKSKDGRRDVWRCLDADSGKQLWSVEYDAVGEMDYSNSPRANPVIHGRDVFLLGAFGDLICADLGSGTVRWRRNIVQEFGAELLTWGMCAAPLVVDGKLIVNPGAPKASLAALDLRTGKTLWQTPGGQAAYSPFIVGRFGGVRQIVGYDADSLGGWAPDTGRRLWTHRPPEDGDFNVPTPVPVGDKLLLATENNGTRLHAFDAKGRLIAKPLAINPDLAPDTTTPVVLDGLVFGSSDGSLFCLDANDGLKTLWSQEDDLFMDHASFIGGNGRLLVMTIEGELQLVAADRKRYRLLGSQNVFGADIDEEVWSHPALVGNRLYIRGAGAAVCILLTNVKAR